MIVKIDCNNWLQKWNANTDCKKRLQQIDGKKDCKKTIATIACKKKIANIDCTNSSQTMITKKHIYLYAPIAICMDILTFVPAAWPTHHSGIHASMKSIHILQQCIATIECENGMQKMMTHTSKHTSIYMYLSCMHGYTNLRLCSVASTLIATIDA